ncbi:mechanosensitive ion channel family protein [Acidiphilium acidophilum]|uniref:Mechanosensitive ion channel n=1 Tax=Acidiphilium acidophilum TaxID=76588 RepID=A0AAW9DRD6_ACIAO|nr:mechanosensitive ion channel domain-containing protein [Acidiphilium acidophilum]MDX5931461.1 mechanosensitive ion channel [Acidiphilium acidophilum]
MRLIRSLAIALIVCLAGITPSHAAENPLAALMAKPAATPKPAPTTPGTTPHTTPGTTLDSAQINAAIATLNNPAQRNALIATLQAMKAPAATPAKPGTPTTTTITTAAPAMGIGFVQIAEMKTRLVLGEIITALREATDIRLIWHWLVFVATDAWLRQTVIHAAIRLAAVLATALIAEAAAIFLLRRPRAAIIARAARWRDSLIALDAEDPESEAAGLAAAEAGETEPRPRRRSLRRWFRRLPYAIGHFLLALVPIVIFAAVGFIWLSGSIANERVARLVIIAVLNAYLACRVTLEIARFLLAPRHREIRLIRTTDRRATWLVTWLRRIIAVIAFGYAAIATGTLFGLYHAASQVLVKLVSLIVHVMLAIMVLQARRPVAAIIRGDRPGRPPRTGLVAAMRAGLARSWYVLALFYIVALWIAWAIGVPHAFVIMLKIVLIFAVIISIARSMTTWIDHGLESAFDPDAAWHEQYPILHARGRMYLPILKLAIGAIIAVIAVLVILQLWGLGILSWFAVTAIGRRIVGAVITIALATIIGLIVWEIINAALENHAEHLIAQGRAGRAARYRTLLPMMRSTLLVIILVIVALVVLSAIGVNVTLLLGGLSIFGLAVGFGSQKLVQDIITGLFLLLEDAMQVGDSVTLGGMSGVVEKLSIRTIRLRGGDGSLNIIPFSSVTTVTNSSRDFGYAPINIGVGYNEDIDKVQAVIHEIFETMRAEPTWAAQISNDLELWGLDQFGASSVNIVGRIKTPAGKQYGVRREFNRRVKIRFDADGIELPYNYQRITIDPAEFRQAFGPPKTDAPKTTAPTTAPETNG